MLDDLERWFHRAVEADDPEREQILREARSQGAELAAELERLVERELRREPAADSAEPPLAGGGGSELTWARALARTRLLGSRRLDASRDEAAIGPGSRLGPYRLLELIGRGGMGEVYLAERADGQYVQRVALKTLQVARSSDELLARFRAERQILALLEHPDIARLLDGAVDERGVPYLVMELVHGRPITEACDSMRLDLVARLRLFVRVCRAVQHAHANLIVHRDLKPSNLLVDEDGAPKLLDFGVAKLLDVARPELTSSMPETSLFGSVFTPDYASPEQVGGQQVGTATDVYALGLLLFELLTGQRAQRIEGATWAEIERRICHQPLASPSATLAALVAKQPDRADDLARLRRLRDGGELRRKLRGDLDLIVATAAHKDPRRRYGSAAALADDVERHLDELPVRAHPDGWLYRTRKLVRRRPGTVLAAALVVASLTLAAVGSGVGLLRARAAEEVAQREAAVANEVTEFMVDLFAANDPANARGREVSAREILERGARRVTGELDASPTVKSRLFEAIAQAYRGLGAIEEEASLREVTLELAQREYGADSIESGRALVALGEVAAMRGDYERSRDLTVDGVEVLERVAAAPHELGLALGQLGRALGQLREHDRAIAVLERAAELLQSSPSGRARAWIPLSNLGAALLSRRDFAPAEEVLLEARSLALEQRDDMHPDVLGIDMNRAQAVKELGRLEDALALHLRVLEGRRRVLPAEHPLIGASVAGVAATLLAMERLEEALPYAQEALELTIASRGAGHPSVATSLHNLAEVELRSGRPQRAAVHYERELEILEPLPRSWDLRRAEPLIGLVEAYRALGDPQAAAEAARRAVEILDRHDLSGDAWLAGKHAELRAFLGG
ncbi:MAG: serine/threonine protein kinase [Acidobacteria bacterium]|nr:MAG: serine/threonine protein kinase [Acidobacteriota bacterium]REK09516.1 MAG: serine/threonine protein kinase [Acidobacteriota bacterium]